MSKRVKSKAIVDSSDSSNAEEEEEVKEPVKKKKKTEEKQESEASSSKQEDGSFVFPLNNKRQVTVREFKSKILIDIREFYEDAKSGEMKPGRKGISLQREQWEMLKNLVADIDEAIEELRG